MSDLHSAADISDVLGVQPSERTPSGEWVIEASAEGDEASLDDLIVAVTNPLFGVADRLSALAREGATVELHLTRELLGPGVGALCFMLDNPVIKFLAQIGAAVWFDEYDEVIWERDAHTKPA